MSITENLKATVDDSFSCGDPTYSLDELKAHAKELIEVTPGHWLALWTKDGETPADGWLEFALFSFAMSDIGGKNTQVCLVFEGSGPTGSLRECRHIHWGPDKEGYTFYLPGTAVIKSLEHLQKYFDFR